MVEQEPQVAPDAVTEEQDQLEQQQGALDQPQYVTADQFNAYQQQMSQLQGMQNSLQSKIDRGLNSIRAEYEQAYQQQQAQAKAQQFEDALAEVPEEQQAAMRMLWQQSQAVSQPQQPAQPQNQGQEQQVQTVMEQAREYVRRQGLNPDDPSIDYGALFNGDAMTFADSLGNLQTKRLQSTAPAAPQQAPQTQRPREGNPSVSPAAAQSTSMNSDMDIIDARTRGEIDHQTMIERLRGIGSPLADQMNVRH
jgi:hypothetical protein